MMAEINGNWGGELEKADIGLYVGRIGAGKLRRSIPLSFVGPL